MTNGTVDGPAQALRDFLLRSECRRLTCVYHPLLQDERPEHVVTVHESGVLRRHRTIRLPSRPPITYPLDLLAPLRFPEADCWFGFNALASARGLFAKRRGMCRSVVYWCVDFTPDRFGRSPLTTAFDWIDRRCCEKVDARFELSEAGRVARDRRHEERGSYTPARARIVPMGAWLDRADTVPPDAFGRRRIVYMGHLAPGKGVALLIDALGSLQRNGVTFSADIIGRGPLEVELRERARRVGVADRVTFHGFVADHRDVERLLAGGSIAAAPYEDGPGSFTQFADPGKLRAYLAAGLPTVMTDVPPNAGELASQAGVIVAAAATPIALAKALEDVLASETQWRDRRDAALRYARSFDWPMILGPALDSLGFQVSVGQQSSGY